MEYAAVPEQLSVGNLCVDVKSDGGLKRVVSDVGFSLREGGRLGIAGESGSGKTQLLRALQGVSQGTVSGTMIFEGAEVEVAKPLPFVLRRRKRSSDSRYRMGMVFQEPQASFSPYQTVLDHAHDTAASAEGQQADIKLHVESTLCARLSELGFASPEAYLGKYPHELSGGEAQRVTIALALMMEPRLILADEPTTQLDALIQVQVLELLDTVIRDKALSLILVSHDLAVLGKMVDRILVLKNGQVVDYSDTQEILFGPIEALHPYTQTLRRAVE
ncbi:MAG: ATP-binding cassette domain-containing protein [Rhodothermales bacterium]